MKTPLWQHEDFPQFYYNASALQPFEEEFADKLGVLCRELIRQKGTPSHDEVIIGEIIDNSEIEGVSLDRDSVRSSFQNNLPIKNHDEKGAIEVMKMALDHYQKPIDHELIKSMHRALFDGSDMPSDQHGVYVGDMKIISNRRLDQEPTVEALGVPQGGVNTAMDDFIQWSNKVPQKTSLLSSAIQAHLHFEIIHPFADGNGRIGRALIQHHISRSWGQEIPLALSRVIVKNKAVYYKMFQCDLDITEEMKVMGSLMLQSIDETYLILKTTKLRTLAYEAFEKQKINERQSKVIERLIDYELRGEFFEGGLSNKNYRAISQAESKTAQRDLDKLVQDSFLTKTGQLKGTRYFLNNR